MRKQTRSQSHLESILGRLVVFLLISASPLFAQRTDVVIMRNGDNITGEISKLDRGILTYKTDDMGALSIEWDMIDFIESENRFDVETRWGQHFIGSLERGENKRQLRVRTLEAHATLALADIVRIDPLEASFFKRLKGYLDAGFSYQSANKFAEFTFGGEVDHRTVKWSNKLSGSTYIRTQKEGNDTTRSNFDYVLNRIFRNRWSGGAFASLEQNDELNLVLRALAGLGGGRYFVQNNNMLLLVILGLTTSREKRTGDEDFKTNFEAILAGSFDAFRYVSPKLDFTVSLNAFPSMTDWGRIRLNFDTRLRYEVLSDFFITVKVFDKLDADLRGGGEKRNDFGIDTTISWSFK
jgi:hypothetical protein